MNAYVIDQKQFKRYVIEIIVALVIAFSLGFVLGMQQTQIDTGSDQIVASENETNLQSAEVTDDKLSSNKPSKPVSAAEKAAEIKNKKKAATEKALLEKQKSQQNNAEQDKVAKEKLALKKLAEKKLAKQKQDQEKLAQKKLAQKKIDQEKAAKEKAAKEKAAKAKQALALEKKKQQAAATDSSAVPAPSSSQKTQSTKRSFSIQAGMFASKSNAESFIEKLEAKNFEAYVSDFESSNGTTKYNVRVGKFENREKARESLKEFQKSFSSPAYVVIAQ